MRAVQAGGLGLSRAAQDRGRRVAARHEATEVSVGEDEVTVVAKTKDGPKAFKGDFLIAGDGGRSLVRKALGVEFEGFHLSRAFSRCRHAL